MLSSHLRALTSHLLQINVSGRKWKPNFVKKTSNSKFPHVILWAHLRTLNLVLHMTLTLHTCKLHLRIWASSVRMLLHNISHCDHLVVSWSGPRPVNEAHLQKGSKPIKSSLRQHMLWPRQCNKEEPMAHPILVTILHAIFWWLHQWGVRLLFQLLTKICVMTSLNNNKWTRSKHEQPSKLIPSYVVTNPIKRGNHKTP